MKNIIAVIGASGNVGRKILEIMLESESIHPSRLRLFASKRSAGKTLHMGTHDFVIEDIDNYNFNDCQVALFATDSDISKIYVPHALNAGAKVIDSSSAYRLDEQVPLIVPPVNASLIKPTKMLYATANCLACPISIVLKPLHNYAQIKRVLASTYQSTSGAGKKAMDELYDQTKSTYENRLHPPTHFNRPIAFNVIPQVDNFLEDGSTYEELKIINEIKKIISPAIKIAVTAVRVPVMIGHSISLAVEFANEVNIEKIKNILEFSPGVKLCKNDYCTPLEVAGKNEVYVGRLRQDISTPNGILLWLTSDNLRRGAALDAVEILQILTKNPN